MDRKIGGRIKQRIEDFQVEEIPKTKENTENDATIFWMKKFNWDTNKALGFIAKSLHVSTKRLGVAGTKDKRAVTRQRVSVWNIPKERLQKIKLKDIELYDFSSGDRLNLGDLEGNKFVITIRDINLKREELEPLLKEKITKLKKGIPNYFGPQRFGDVRPITHLVGMEMLKGNFKEAVKIYTARVFPKEPDDAKEARNFLEKNWNKQGFLKSIKKFPKRLNYERTMIDYLYNYPRDYAGALRRLPKRLRKMFLNAVQAYVWNEVAKKEDLKKEKMSLVSYDSKNLDPETRKLLKKIDIRPNMFLMRSMPELKCSGGERKLLLKPKNLKIIEISKDEFNEGKLKATISFTLPSGSYATVILKEIME